MDWTDIGAPPPTFTLPTAIWRVGFRSILMVEIRSLKKQPLQSRLSGFQAITMAPGGVGKIIVQALAFK
jgi:hypothetical protein